MALKIPKFKFQVRFPFGPHKPGDVLDWDDVEEQFRNHNFGVKVLAPAPIENKGPHNGATKNIADTKGPKGPSQTPPKE
jgi:hypothetical protein